MPFLVENKSPFPHFAFRKTGPDGSLFGVLAVRATFEWVHDGEMIIAPTQQPVLIADEYDGPPEQGALRLESDLIIGKPQADILVVGHAHAPGNISRQNWIAGIKIGEQFGKSIRVLGPRWWERGAMGFRLTPSQAVGRVPLTYRIAFGGTRRVETRQSRVEEHAFELNPVGIGFKGRFSVDEPLWPAPQTEAHDQPIRAITDCPMPEGFGPIARPWLPRRAHLGSLSVEFVRQNPGKLPDDFDWAFYNSAPPALVYPDFLNGDEAIETHGLFPEGNSASKLPGYAAIAVLELANGIPLPVKPKFDTLVVDTDARKVYATFRLTFPMQLHVRTVVLGFAVPPPAMDGQDKLISLKRKGN